MAEALERKWLKIEHAGGGGNIRKKAEECIAGAVDKGRVQALSDSDRLHPDHESTTIRTMRKIASELGIRVHILHKRDSENYLPHEGVDHYGRKTVYRAFRQLNEQQKDYYDMKSGFRRKSDGTLEIPAEQEQIYADVPRAVLEKLAGGFGDRQNMLFQGVDGKVPHYITKTQIEARCVTKPEELTSILDAVERML
ncbi:MAG: hypothetical protein HC927_01355 [Deltaproteobacteria bacterium]|nr:hypothetical protein [Deltaproteobacteria bacterium]